MSAGPDLQDLFAAARDDAPTDAVRTAVWDRVAMVTSTVPAAACATAAAKTAASTKLLTLGAFAIASGTGAIVLAVMSWPDDGARGAESRSESRWQPARVERPHGGVRLADPTPRGRAETDVRTTAVEPTWRPPEHHDDPARQPASQDEGPEGATQPRGEGSALAEEARLVTEARRALVRGDARGAYTLARRTRTLPVRALEPEELVLEARALRAMGRVDDALATELTLKQRYPGHSLAR